MRFRLYKAIALFATLLLASVQALPVSAQDKAAPTMSAETLAKNRQANLECFACHSEAGLHKLPKEGLDLTKLKGLLHNPETFGQSDHQRLACTKCHNDGYEEHPHAADAKESTSTCTDCHSKKANLIEKQFEQSVHAKLADTISCPTCHNPHLMRLADKLGDPRKIVAQDNRVCLSCHDSDDKFAKFAPDKKSRPLIDDIHDWLPNTRLHWKAVRCVECHTPAVAAGEMISHQILSKDKAEKNCLSCHSANSTLKTRLYRHLVKEEQEKLGFANSIILAQSYVLGATRHPLLDTLVLGAFAAMLLGLLAHGLGRFISRRKEAPSLNKREYLIAGWIRVWHWTNALLILTLGITGMSVHFADPDRMLVEFSLAVRLHNIAGVTLIGTYLFFVIANIVSGNWWQFVPKPPGIFQRILKQALWYGFGIFKGEPHPHEPSKEEHFNALQAVTYWNVMYLLMPLILISGLVYLYPEFAPDTLFGFNGLLPIALLHYLSAVAILLFMLSHIYLGTTGKTVGQMFKMMFTGWHEH